MKTVNELKKCPQHALRVFIDLEVNDCRKGRETELNTDYLKRHSDTHIVPSWILEDNKQRALHYTLGSLQALLKIAIVDLQTAESKLKDNEYADSKVVRVPLEDWDKIMKESGIR